MQIPPCLLLGFHHMIADNVLLIVSLWWKTDRLRYSIVYFMYCFSLVITMSCSSLLCVDRVITNRHLERSAELLSTVLFSFPVKERESIALDEGGDDGGDEGGGALRTWILAQPLLISCALHTMPNFTPSLSPSWSMNLEERKRSWKIFPSTSQIGVILVEWVTQPQWYRYCISLHCCGVELFTTERGSSSASRGWRCLLRV